MPVQKEKAISAADRLRQLLKNPDIILMAACYDALSAKLVESAGFAATFMSGFGVAASRLGLPDTGLISYGEMLAMRCRYPCWVTGMPVSAMK